MRFSIPRQGATPRRNDGEVRHQEVAKNTYPELARPEEWNACHIAISLKSPKPRVQRIPANQKVVSDDRLIHANTVIGAHKPPRTFFILAHVQVYFMGLAENLFPLLVTWITPLKALVGNLFAHGIKCILQHFAKSHERIPVEIPAGEQMK